MNISRKWLREFVDIQASDKEYADTMTLVGQKVETVTRLDTEIKNVVVGKVLSIVRHENSDHMWVCQIDVGAEEPVQIVTGAQNVREGDLVPTCLHNSYLPGGVHITKGKLRGVASCGMLCSFKELGLTQNDVPDACEDGIWILNHEDCRVGQDINEVIGNDDTVVEFEITNNRPDCYSLISPHFWTSRFRRRIFAAGIPRAWCAMSALPPPPSGCGSVCARPAFVPSTTSLISRTTSWSNTASRCTPLTIAM